MMKMGKGKEYNYKGEIEFEGEYLKGVKNGKGKEYFKNGKIKFEGEYLNGKRLNGKAYDTNNKIIYKLKDGKGYIKEYNYKGEIEFEGEYLNGEKIGKGKEYYCGVDANFEEEYYIRKFKSTKYSKLFIKLKFEGEYLNGKRLNGNGYDINNNIVYKLKDGKGYIKEYNYKGEIEFEGEYLNGEKNGKGKEYS